MKSGLLVQLKDNSRCDMTHVVKPVSYPDIRSAHARFQVLIVSVPLFVH